MGMVLERVNEERGEEVLCQIKRIIIQGPLGNMLTHVVRSTFIERSEKYF